MVGGDQERPELVLKLVAEPNHPRPWIAARAFLKALLRRYGWRVTAIIPDFPADDTGEEAVTTGRAGQGGSTNA
jgi:hypothetical protein